MLVLKTLFLALVAIQAPGILGSQPQRRNAISNDPYPYCDPAENDRCIVGGKYLVPALDFSLENDAGDVAYDKYLPTHTFTLSQWTNGKMPETCYKWGVKADHWNPADFKIYNVTFSDCNISPFVVCWNNKSSKSIKEIATAISRIPIGMRQSLSTYIVYGDKESDNPKYNGLIATLAADGLIVGRSSAYFTTSLVHETGHAIDSTLASPDAPSPGSGSEFSSTSKWQDAVDADGYAVSAYGAGSYVENFADTGRAVLLDNIYPGGLAAWSNNNPNLTQITNSLEAFKSVAGKFYTTGGKCDLSRKFPFPTSFVVVPTDRDFVIKPSTSKNA